MSKTINNAKSGLTFKQGLQLFFVWKILDDRYTMGLLVGSDRGNEFFGQWSRIVCEGREKDESFPCTIKVPTDFGREPLEEGREQEIVLTVQQKKVRKTMKEGGEDLSFAPKAYHSLMQNSRFSGLINLLGDEDLGQLMRIEYPSEAEVAEIAAVVGTSKDADIIREAIARQLNKKPDELKDEDYSEITELFLSGLEISNLDPIKGLRNLQRLELERTQVADLEPIKGLSSLEWLNLMDTKVSDLEPIKRLRSLEILDLEGTRVNNLEPIKRLNSLRELYLNNTQVSDLEPLKGLSNLQGFLLRNTQVSNLEPIRELRNLVRIDIEDTPVSDEQVEGLQKALPELNISR